MNNENSNAENDVDNTNTQQPSDKKIPGDNTVKNPDDWTTGDEPMTGAQHSYLKTLSDEAGETLDENLTKAAASKKINELQQKTGRGADRQQ